MNDAALHAVVIIWSALMPILTPFNRAAGLAITLSLLASTSTALAGLNFLTQDRWIEVTYPSDGTGIARTTSPGFTKFDESLSQFGTNSSGAAGRGDASQSSTLADKLTASGTASAIGGGPLGTGSGTGESYFKTTFTADTDTDFFFTFNASSFSSSVVQYYSFAFTGEGVNFASNPDSFRLVFGQTFDLSGSGVLKAGTTYTIEIDLYVMGDGAGTNGDGTFALTMTTVPAPASIIVPGGLAMACIRRRRNTAEHAVRQD